MYLAIPIVVPPELDGLKVIIKNNIFRTKKAQQMQHKRLTDS
jgi:hypothetical protein